MAHINFVLPQTKNDLLSHESDQYFVRDVIGPKEIYSKLKVAKQCLRDEGPDFILDNFDVYFSIFLRPESHTMESMMTGYLDLHKAVTDLNKNIGFILEDKDSLNDELKAKCQTILKMLLYAYTNMVVTIEHKIDVKRQNTLQSKAKSKKKSADSSEDEGVNKKGVVLVLINILDRDIGLFWDPPVVEEVFINMVSEVFYRFLEFPSLKNDRELRSELFNAIGILLKKYNHGMTFNVRITQLIKLHEHLMFCIPEGIQLLVNNYNCKGLVRNFIREITEWQTDENYQDSQGTKFCSGVLTEMAKLMPDLMIPEVMYLNQYLAHDSYTLRNSVLNVIAEVVLTVLSKDNLNEEDRDSRDEFLEILEDHIFDTSSHVRAKVVQHWAKLQKENAIPLSVQNGVLEKIVGRLYDKAAIVRKNAANCVSTFLTHNIYGAELQLSKMEKELQQKLDDINRYKSDMCQNTTNKLKEVDDEWASKEEKLKEVIAEKLQEENVEEENEENSDKVDEEKNLASESGIPALIRKCIVEEKFDEAFKMCRLAVKHLPQWKESSKSQDKREELKLFIVLMKTIFYGQGSQGAFVDIEANFTALENLESHVQFLTNCVGFLKQIDKAIRPMKELLESTSVGDMQEAVDFFVTAFQFKIENALDGVLAMLKIMQRSEQDRKEYVVNAFKTIYLTTDTKSMKEHTTTIVDRLIHLLKTTPYDSLSDFSLIVTEWTAKGILDNSVIDALWQCFTKQRDVSEDDSRAAVDLLAMAAKGRKTIISKNLKMIATVAFTDRGEKDLLFLASACKLMAIAGTEKQNMTDKNPPFRIKMEDPIWTDVMSILEKTFFKADPFYPTVTSAVAELTYRLCSRPEQLWEEFIQKMIGKIADKYKGSDELPRFIIIQCGHLFGEVAIKELHFLDEVTYKELKRRQFIREEKNDNKKNKKHNRTVLANASSSRRKSRVSSVDTDETNKMDESVLEGVQAGDPEAEFILNVLENDIVTGNGLLEKFAPLLVMVCERPDVYDCLMLQGTFSVALLRYMLVSSCFCEKNLQLVFTMLEKTKFSEVKINIMIHLCDLLERFPNIVEPWTPRMYERLKDNDFDVRHNTFYLLSNLILRDMIRIQGHIAKMARCLVDNSDLLKDMSKNFFTLLSHRANNLYNVLPDIFSHLIEDKDLEEEQTRYIMQFLFSLIEKNKHMENLVERFCLKLSLTEEPYICRNVAYCLSLIQYTDRGLRKLIDSFQMYKRLLVDNEVYAFFKQIINTCNKSVKNEVKAMAVELEERINSAFDSDEKNENEENKTPNKVSQKASKTPFKKPRGRAPPKKKHRKQDDDEDEDGTDSDGAEDKENGTKNANSARKSTRTIRTLRRPKKIQDSDSGSD